MKDGRRVDVDLSVSFLDEKMEYVEHVSYTNLKAYGSVHSGDFVNGGEYGGKGVSEFADLDLVKLERKGICYASVQVYNFTGFSFSKLPCMFGWMQRSHPKSGEIYEPATVENTYTIASDTTAAMPVIIDILNRELIWVDISAGNRRTLESCTAFTGMTLRGFVEKKVITLQMLLMVHAAARGTIVSEREEADILFSNDPSRPIIRITEQDENGNPVCKEVEKEVTVKDAYDLAYYAALI